MVNGIVPSLLRSMDFRFQGFDPGVQFRNGKRVEILPGYGSQNVIGLARLIFFHVHAGNVDPNTHSVNKDGKLLIPFFAAAQQWLRDSSIW